MQKWKNPGCTEVFQNKVGQNIITTETHEWTSFDQSFTLRYLPICDVLKKQAYNTLLYSK